MSLQIPAVDVNPPSVENADPAGWADMVFGFIAAHPVPLVLLVFAILLTKWLTKPFVKGILLGCLIAAIVVFAIGG